MQSDAALIMGTVNPSSENISSRRNKPIAQLIPIEEEKSDLFERMKGPVRVVGDIISPIDEIWDASR